MDEILIDCSPGISGDMLLSAFHDLGVPQTIFEIPLKKLGLTNFFSLSFHESKSYSFRGIKTEVNIFKDNEKRQWKDIKKLILKGGLGKNLESLIIKVFESLAIAEGQVHGINPDEVHFHEIGSLDSLVDVIGVCAAVDHLNPKKIYCNSPNLGKGFVFSEHGKIPIPSPVVLELISKSNIEICSDSSIDAELSTPTGIALLLTLVNSFKLPYQYSINSYGIGIGHKNLPFPNLLRVLNIDVSNSNKSHPNNHLIFEEISIQEAWLDDSTPEEIASFVEFMREGGVLDISYKSINMKKNRVGFSITAILPIDKEDYFRKLWFQNTNTIGVRERRQRRWILPRREGQCLTSLGKIKCKEIVKPDGQIFIKAEHDEIVKFQKKYNKTFQDIKNIIYETMEDFQPLRKME